MNEPPPRFYALRILPRAERDIDQIMARLADNIGSEAALAWHDGLFIRLASLSQNPGRCVLVDEQRRFRQNVRQILYRRTPASAVWRILFTVTEAPDDAPTVFILHVRHSAQRPITQAEARQIEGP